MRAPRGLMLDMDGLLYHGYRVLPGALAFLGHWSHLPRVFVTNNPIATAGEIADRLAGMGFERPAPALVRTGRFAPGEPLPANCAAPDWDVDHLDQLTAAWCDKHGH